MILIQILIIAAALIIALFVLTRNQTYLARAWKKIGLTLLAIVMIIAVIFPELTTQLAHLVGVGRGADLLLYVLSLTVIGYILNTYIAKQREKDTMFRLARRIALLEANEKYGIHTKE